jgi:hypothetical protein
MEANHEGDYVLYEDYKKLEQSVSGSTEAKIIYCDLYTVDGYKEHTCEDHDLGEVELPEKIDELIIMTDVNGRLNIMVNGKEIFNSKDHELPSPSECQECELTIRRKEP